MDNTEGHYDLQSNIVHVGSKDQVSGQYKIHVKKGSEWLEIQDLHVDKIFPQQVLVSECYIQIYKKVSEEKISQDQQIIS